MQNDPSRARFVPSLAALALVCGAALAQESAPPRALAPRWIAPKTERVVLTPGHDPRRVILKVRDDARTAARGGRLELAQRDGDLDQLRDLITAFGARVEPLFELAADELAGMRRAGEANTGQALADLSQYFLLVLDGDNPLEVVRALRANAAVEEAYVATAPPPLPGDVFPATPLYDTCGGPSACQAYLEAAPAGIDARWAWTQLSGRGGGRRIADVEYAWNIPGAFGSTNGHEDLAGVIGQVPAPPVGDTSTWVNPVPGDTNHGTAVAGILAADLDSWGVSGIAPNATLRVSGALFSSGLNIAAAIMRASRVLRPGDTLLIEMQNFGPNYTGSGQRGMLPVEYYSAEYNAIRQVTALCIHVVEAAGNGEQDFAGTSAPFGDTTYTRFDPRVRHSGATMIGAGTASVPHLRMWFSNFGERIDAYAWGENVVTTGYGDLFAGGVLAPDPDQFYTSSFAGTSSASAIVAGATTVLNATHQRLHGQPWRPVAMERFLRTSGTATSAQFNEQIGRQPDLRDQLEILSMGPEPALVFTDETAGAFVLDDVAHVGDVDQDGTPDYAVGAGDAGSGYGHVTVYSGLTGEVLFSRNGNQLGEKFGKSIAGDGDVNNDGVPDFVIGAPSNSSGGTDAGRVYVYSGANLALLHSFAGQTGDNLGHAVDMLGDVDGDGYDDFVAGAFGDAAGTGQVFAWSGQTGAVLYTWSGAAAGDHFGQSVAAAGDMNDDGTPDVVIGGPFAGGLQNGSARAYSGADGSLLAAYTGFDNYGWFGFSVAGVGDVNGDGKDDVLIGSPNWNGGFGKVNLYSGAGGELYPGLISGGGASSNFGASVASAGDHDGDGTPDLLVGSPLYNIGSNSAHGAVHVFSGASGAWLETYFGQSAGSYLGTSVSPAADLDGDGRGDVLLGARWWGPAPSAGRGYVFLAPNPGLCIPRNATPQ